MLTFGQIKFNGECKMLFFCDVITDTNDNFVHYQNDISLGSLENIFRFSAFVKLSQIYPDDLLPVQKQSE